jgi:DnaJ-class molecular chaperone
MNPPENYYNPTIDRKVDKEIVICQHCKGTGILPIYNDSPYYEGPRTQQCPVCAGLGRRQRIVITEYELVKI